MSLILLALNGCGGESTVDDEYGYHGNVYDERLVVTTTDTTESQSVSFGRAYIGLSRQKTITLTNTGTANVSSIVFEVPSGFTIVDQTCTDALKVGNKCNVVLSFKPTTAGTNTGTLNISYQKLRKTITQSVNLNGDGLAIEGVKVTGVFLKSSSWANSFLTAMDTFGLGHTTITHLGYSVPTGSTQLRTLPWSNLNTLTIQFSTDVTIESSDLVLETSVSGSAAPTIQSFTYNSASYLATWQFSSTLTTNKYKIVLLDNVTSVSGEPLDGEWTKSVSTFPSGDGTPGGEFAFQFNILKGDLDHSDTTDNTDHTVLRDLVGLSDTQPNYDIYADFNGSGAITAGDLIIIVSNNGASISSYKDP